MARVGSLAVGAIPCSVWAPQFFQVPYTALIMLLTPNPRERDSGTAYRECTLVGVGWGEMALPPGPMSSITLLCVPSQG